MAEPTIQTPPAPAAAELPPLPRKRARRRAVRGSYSWCWRRPPSRRRVQTASGRFKVSPQVPPVAEICTQLRH